jgi:hypothetical protein
MAFSAAALEDTVLRFRRAAAESGRDAALLRIVVRANVPITGDDLTGRRPFLGGSAGQIAADLRSIEHLAVDHVMFTNLRQPPIGEQVALAEALMTAHTSRSRRKTMESRPPSPGRVLSQILVGNRVQQAVHVAAKLGVADLMVAVKSRFTRSGAGVCRGFCRVDPPRRPRRKNAPCQPWAAINRSTRLRPTRNPSRPRCRWTRPRHTCARTFPRSDGYSKSGRGRPGPGHTAFDQFDPLVVGRLGVTRPARPPPAPLPLTARRRPVHWQSCQWTSRAAME